MRAVVPVLCAAVLVAGCGDDDDETTVVETTTTTTIETVPAPSEPDVTTPDQMGEDVVPEAQTNGHGGVEAPQNCGRIAFNPSTDSGAAAIKAAGTDCETARAVARAARNATDELSYEAEGFRCAGARSEDAGLSSVEWFCLGPDREVVNFVTT